ncbi:MAG TPA: hypothetical protein VNT22_07555 [Baekduia sp.]|nr:hypothetical protein [Baekduia sp.]
MSLVAALALVGCGSVQDDSSKDFKGEQAKVAKAIEDLEKAAAKRPADTKKICSDLFTDALAKRIAAADTNDTCKDRLDDAIGDVVSGGVSGTKLDVEKVTISGSGATAVVKNDAGDSAASSTFKLAKVGANWRIDSF